MLIDSVTALVDFDVNVVLRRECGFSISSILTLDIGLMMRPNRGIRGAVYVG